MKDTHITLRARLRVQLRTLAAPLARSRSETHEARWGGRLSDAVTFSPTLQHIHHVRLR